MKLEILNLFNLRINEEERDLLEKLIQNELTESASDMVFFSEKEREMLKDFARELMY